MGRLTDILLEQEGSATAINVTEITKSSEAGNLFRLLLVLDPSYTPQLNGTTIINKLLPEISKNTKKDIKSTFAKLKIEFNKVVTPKKGTASKKISRNIYFDAVLRLLLPQLKSPQFKLTNLKAIYKSDDNVDIQRVTTAKIGKDLLNNQDITLTSIDINFIKNFVSHHDTPEAVENTTNNKQIISDDVSKKMSTKSDEELDAVIANVEKITNSVNAMHVDTTDDIRTKLKTNTDASSYNVTFSDQDAKAGIKINKLIANNFNSVKKQHGLETANFISTLSQNIFKYLNDETNGYLNYFQDAISFTVEKTDKGLQFTTLIGFDENTHPLRHDRFKITQIFNTDTDGKSNVYLDEIQMPLSYQKNGLFKNLFKDMLNTYKAQGIEKISLEANVDVGGYAWFRFGFTPTDIGEIKHISSWMRSEASRFAIVAETDKESLIKHIETTSSDTTTNKTTIMPEVSNLINFIKESSADIIKPVIIELINVCSLEFENAFDDKNKFKNLNEYISTHIFVPQMIKGCKYPISLSCKSLLTLYMMKDVTSDDKTSIINVPAAGYLGWHGELLLDDLEDTYAYLNLK